MQGGREGLKAFVEVGSGLSVHWESYTLLGRGEWVYYLERIPWEAYRRPKVLEAAIE